MSIIFEQIGGFAKNFNGHPVYLLNYITIFNFKPFSFAFPVKNTEKEGIIYLEKMT
jgi:hypothetical protein